MKAMLLQKVSDLNFCKTPLEKAEIPMQVINQNEVLIRILFCGVCYTELDEIEGRIIPVFYPIIPGHQVIEIIEKVGENAKLHGSNSFLNDEMH